MLNSYAWRSWKPSAFSNFRKRRKMWGDLWGFRSRLQHKIANRNVTEQFSPPEINVSYYKTVAETEDEHQLSNLSATTTISPKHEGRSTKTRKIYSTSMNVLFSRLFLSALSSDPWLLWQQANLITDMDMASTTITQSTTSMAMMSMTHTTAPSLGTTRSETGSTLVEAIMCIFPMADYRLWSTMLMAIRAILPMSITPRDTITTRDMGTKGTRVMVMDTIKNCSEPCHVPKQIIYCQ